MAISYSTRTPRAVVFLAAAACLLSIAAPGGLHASQFNGGNYTLLSWNDLGMHCMDDDYSVFSLLPPFNTINAQLIDDEGRLVNSASGITITYQAVADPDGSANTSSTAKTNFWTHAAALYGAALGDDAGLTGKDMPGIANTPKPMTFDPALDWWIASGIPLTPVDDAGHANSYPMMEVVARTTGGTFLASTRIVLPVSSEMDCRACHGSGSPQPVAPAPSAQPAGGWEYDADPVRDYRLNVLKVHDEHQAGNPLFTSTLATAGYSTNGLYDTVTNLANPKPVLCAACHTSEALPGSGIAGVVHLTQALHTLHANAINPDDGLTMDSSVSRTSCYQCHPGSDTRCLRGAMGAAVAPDGALAMQCQSCHGSMSEVGSLARTGWLDEPACQSCHTGTATANNGQIRYDSVFEALGVKRVAVNNTFATNADAPAPGFSLYRFSAGHAGLQCSACHGSTHAVFPSSHRNDNIQSLMTQGHVGTVADCTSCHKEDPESWNGGPHGMHSIGAKWARDHGDAAQINNAAACKDCHGTDFKGTVLSRALGPRTFTTKFGTVSFFKGATVTCFACHNGPHSENTTSNLPPVVANTQLATPAGTPGQILLAATDPNAADTVSIRIVNQPQYGTVGFDGATATATYVPYTGFAGFDYFTYAASDGKRESNLGIVSVTVGGATLATDSDFDGLPDFMEYALGLSPFMPTSSGPLMQLEAVGLAGHMTATLSRCCTPPDTTVEVQVSSDLVHWFSGAPDTSILEDTFTSLKVRDATGTDTAPRRYMRIVTERN